MSAVSDWRCELRVGLFSWSRRHLLRVTITVVFCVHFLGCAQIIFRVTSPRARMYHVITTERLLVGPQGAEIVLDPPLRKGIDYAKIRLTVPVRLDREPYVPGSRDYRVRVRNERGVLVLPSATLTSREGKTYTFKYRSGGFCEEYGESYITIEVSTIPKGEVLVKLRLEANEEFPCTKVEWKQNFGM